MMCPAGLQHCRGLELFAKHATQICIWRIFWLSNEHKVRERRLCEICPPESQNEPATGVRALGVVACSYIFIWFTIMACIFVAQALFGHVVTDYAFMVSI